MWWKRKENQDMFVPKGPKHYPTSAVEDIVASIPGAKVFTVIGAKSGFLQIKVDYESSLLTTFNTPVGRYPGIPLATRQIANGESKLILANATH